MWKAWKILYKKAPSFKETICIFVHDLGYWGKNYYTDMSNSGHAELGAKIAGWLFDKKGSNFYRNLVLGHSSAACKKYGLKKSKLERPDEYSWLIANYKWVNWSSNVENYSIPTDVFLNNVKENFYKREEDRISGTEMLNRYRNKEYEYEKQQQCKTTRI